MLRPFRRLLIPLAAACATGLPATHAQVIENELVLITPVARTLTDPLLADFVKYAKERWNVDVRASALAAGTPIAYGRISCCSMSCCPNATATTSVARSGNRSPICRSSC